MENSKSLGAGAVKGKLIVFEGADGSGKTTQSKLLLNYLKTNKIPAATIAFPRYEESLWAKMVRRYLAGDFGDVNKVDPYLASMLYAGDRASAADQLNQWLVGGKIVVCNRYVGSNMAHMGAKLKSKIEKFKFIKWLEDLEYEENKIPKEDLVIFLNVPPRVSRKLIKNRKLDIHEKDLDYLEGVVNVYRQIAQARSNWQTVECLRSGIILSPQEIHKVVIDVLSNNGII